MKSHIGDQTTWSPCRYEFRCSILWDEGAHQCWLRREDPGGAPGLRLHRKKQRCQIPGKDLDSPEVNTIKVYSVASLIPLNSTKEKSAVQLCAFLGYFFHSIHTVLFSFVLFSLQRSGDEGIYPHLIKFCETHLENLDPRSAALRKHNPVATVTSVKSEEWRQTMDELMVCLGSTLLPTVH